jgi:hypothetical protein
MGCGSFISKLHKQGYSLAQLRAAGAQFGLNDGVIYGVEVFWMRSRGRRVEYRGGHTAKG